MKPQPKKIEKIDAPRAWGREQDGKLINAAYRSSETWGPYDEIVPVRILKEADYRKLLRAWRGK